MSTRAPSPEARAIGELLHWGVAPTRAVPVVPPEGAPRELVELGRLVSIELRGGGLVQVERGPVWLATDVQMRELYLVAEHGIGDDSPSGEVEAITYDTRKDETSAWWRHPFDAPGPLLVGGRLHRGRSRFTINEHGILR